MRIIAGDKRGMRLATLEGEDTRPTLSRVKEAMFSSIQFLLPGAKVLDLFAGSGQLGLETLSRGATLCTFIEQSPEAAEILEKNCRSTGLFQKSRVARMSASSFLSHCKDKFDIILLDPPYHSGILPDILSQVDTVTAPEGLVLCETEKGILFPEKTGGLILQKQYQYGTVLVSRYKKEI